MNKAEEFFFELLSIEPCYEAGDRFFQPFYEFMYRIQSLQRHWELQKKFTNEKVTLLKQLENEGFSNDAVTHEGVTYHAEYENVFSEVGVSDRENFPMFLRGTTIACSLSILESLLTDLSREVAEDLGVKVELEGKRMGFIEQHIRWLQFGCGLDVSIDDATFSKLSAVRQMRNRFIHHLDTDIPEKLRLAIAELVPPEGTEDLWTDDLVDRSIATVCELAKALELAYEQFYESHKPE